MSIISSSHIWIDDRNMAWIDQTNVEVIEIAVERQAGATVWGLVDRKSTVRKKSHD